MFLSKTLLVVNKIHRKGNPQRKNSPDSEYTHQAVVCPECKEKWLSKQVLSAKIKQQTIADLTQLELMKLILALKAMENDETKEIVAKIIERVQHLVDIGLGYLSLDRETTTLSGEESQRVKMVKHLNSSLVVLIYIFDERSVCIREMSTV